MIVMNPWAGAVLTFSGDVNGEVAQVRILQGSNTEIALSDVRSAHPFNNEYYVPAGQDSDAVHVFNRTDTGDVAPKRILKMGGGGTGGNPSVDYEHNLILVSGDDGVHVYNRT